MKLLTLFFCTATMTAAQLVPHVVYPNNGELRWWDTDKTHWMGFRFPAVNNASDQLVTWPGANAAGSLVNDGLGNLSWGAGAAGADLNTANIFTQRQRIVSNAVFPSWISSFTGGKASSFWNGGDASVISFDSAGQLLFQAATNAEIVGALGTGPYVGMIKGDGKFGIGFSSAAQVLDHMLEVNGVAVGSQLAIEGTADAFEGFLRALTLTADRTWDWPDRGGPVALEDVTSIRSMLDTIGSTQGAILFRNGTQWVILAPGTAGQVLQSGGAGANPSWTNASSGSGDVVGPASAVNNNLTAFDTTTGKLIKDSGIATSNVPLKDAANTFTQPQTIAKSGSPFPAFISSATGGKAASLWNGADASVLSFDSAGQLLFQAAANSDILAANAGGTYVGMIKGDGKFGVGFSSASQVLDFMFEANGVAVGSQLGIEGTADAFEGFFRNLSDPFSADRFYDVPNRSGMMVIEDNTSAVNLLNSISNNQGDILYRSSTGWVTLAPGTSGQYLKTQGPAANPIWDSPSGSGAVGTDAIWDAKGDLAVGTGSNTAIRLAAGTNGHVLTADSAEPSGVKWAAAGGGSVATDAIWDTKGDIAVATGANTAAKVPIGTRGQVLVADPDATAGVSWENAAEAEWGEWQIGEWRMNGTTFQPVGAATISTTGTATITSATATRMRHNSVVSAATNNTEFGWMTNVPSHWATHDFDFRVLAGLDSITNVRYWIAVSRSISVLMPNDWPTTTAFAGFRFSTNAADTNWMCISEDDAVGSGTATDSGVAVVAGQTYSFRVTRTDSAVKFWIDNVLVATHTGAASIPDQNDTGSFCVRGYTLEAAAKTMHLVQVRAKFKP